MHDAKPSILLFDNKAPEKKNFPLLVEVRVVGFINDNDHHSLMFSPFCLLFNNST